MKLERCGWLAVCLALGTMAAACEAPISNPYDVRMDFPGDGGRDTAVDRIERDEGPGTDDRLAPDSESDMAGGDERDGCVPSVTCEGKCGTLADDGCGNPLECETAECREDQVCGGTAPANRCGCGGKKPDDCGATCVDFDSDEENCGACGHSCLGGECQAGKCQKVELVGGQASPTAIAVAGSDVYWVNRALQGSVMTLKITADNTVDGVTPVATGQDNPRALAVDATQVFWANEGSGDVWRATRVGFTVVRVANSQSSPSGIALDATFAYWVNAGDGTVWRKLKNAADGTAPSNRATAQLGPTDIAISGPEILWVNAGDAANTGSVMRFGAGAPLATTQAEPAAIAADATTVYWVNNAGGTVMSVAIAGGTPATLADLQPSAIAIAQDATHVYWVNHVAAGGLYRVPKNATVATEPEALVEGLAYPRGLALDDLSVYFVTDANGVGSTGTVQRVAKPPAVP